MLSDMLKRTVVSVTGIIIDVIVFHILHNIPIYLIIHFWFKFLVMFNLTVL